MDETTCIVVTGALVWGFIPFVTVFGSISYRSEVLLLYQAVKRMDPEPEQIELRTETFKKMVGIYDFTFVVSCVVVSVVLVFLVATCCSRCAFAFGESCDLHRELKKTQEELAVERRKNSNIPQATRVELQPVAHAVET